MAALRIVGGNLLQGEVLVSGSKNAALPIIAAALLACGISRLHGTPDIGDVRVLIDALSDIGVHVRHIRARGELHLDTTGVKTSEVISKSLNSTRASMLLVGPLLARFREACVPLPGGCAIGDRNIDQHIKGLEALGSKIRIENGYLIAHAPTGLHAARIVFDKQTVSGTKNLMMAATLTLGSTRLLNAACDPEVVDLARALSCMGAAIIGAGTQEILIEGRSMLHPYEYHVMPDRIECSTFLVAGALSGAQLSVVGGVIEHQTLVIDNLRKLGASILIDGNRVTIERASTLSPIEIETESYPGFPTDMQPLFMALLAICVGKSTIVENVFENRFRHVPELRRMGANICISDGRAEVCGVSKLTGTRVMATDLRAGAALVLAGLIADGETVVDHAFHLDRGYERLEEKLLGVGADIRRFTIEP